MNVPVGAIYHYPLRYIITALEDLADLDPVA